EAVPSGGTCTPPRPRSRKAGIPRSATRSRRQCERSRRPTPLAAGAGLSPVGGSQTQETVEQTAEEAAPETFVRPTRTQGGGPGGNQGGPHQAPAQPGG